MNDKKHKNRLLSVDLFGHHRTQVTAVCLVASMAMVQSAKCADPTQVVPSTDPTIAIVDDPGVKHRRRIRRHSHAPIGDAVTVQKQSRRPSGKRSRKRTPKARKPVQSAEDATIRLHLTGSFELDFGYGILVRGEGNTTTEINHATAAKLGVLVGDWVHDSKPVIQDFLKLIGRMPDTLESTASILRSLADPQAQENLRQVEQVLKLIRPSP